MLCQMNFMVGKNLVFIDSMQVMNFNLENLEKVFSEKYLTICLKNLVKKVELVKQK